MKKDIEKNIRLLDKNDAPCEKNYSNLLAKIDFNIDRDYLDFIKMCNGAEGFIGKNNYVLLWKAEQLIELNPYYEDNKETEELFFFGTDGSNLGYAFDKKSKKIISIDFLDISQVQPNVIADSFEAFLDKLSGN